MSADSSIIPALVITAMFLGFVSKAVPERLRLAVRLAFLGVILVCAVVANRGWVRTGYAAIAVATALILARQHHNQRRNR